MCPQDPSVHVGMLWGEAAPIPMSLYGHPAPDLATPLGATVIQIMHNYNDIKPVNNRYSASPTQNDTRKTLPSTEISFPAGLGLAQLTRRHHQRAGASAASAQVRPRAAPASWEEQSLAEGWRQKQKNWPKLLFHP